MASVLRLFLDHLVARFGAEIQAVHSLELPDLFKGLGLEWRLALEGMQNNTLEQVAKAHVEILGEPFENLQKMLFDSYTCLHPFDLHPIPFLLVVQQENQTFGSLLNLNHLTPAASECTMV